MREFQETVDAARSELDGNRRSQRDVEARIADLRAMNEALKVYVESRPPEAADRTSDR